MIIIYREVTSTNNLINILSRIFPVGLWEYVIATFDEEAISNLGNKMDVEVQENQDAQR